MSKIFEVNREDCEDTRLHVENIKDNFIGIYIHESGIGYTGKVLTLSQATQLRDWLNEQLNQRCNHVYQR